MSDIKKQLVLEVSLGTQKLKSEIAGIKKDLDSMFKTTSGAGSLNTLVKDATASFRKAIKEAAKEAKAELKKAQQEDKAYNSVDINQKQVDKLYKIKGAAEDRHNDRARKGLEKQFDKEQTILKKAESLKKQRDNERYQKEESEFLKSTKQKSEKEQKQERDKAARRRKESAVEEREEREKASRIAQAELKERLRIKKEAEIKGTWREALFGNPYSPGVPSGTGGTGGAGSGKNGLAMGLAALLRVGAEVYDFSQFRRTQNAQIVSSQNAAIKSGDYVGGQIQGFRSTKHGLGRMFSDIATTTATGAAGGATVGGIGGAGVFSLPGAGLGALIGGAGGLAYGTLKAGKSYLTGQQEERERLMLETEPARQAQERQRQISNMRFDLLRQTGRTMGGANPLDRMTTLQGLGTANGFSQDETLSQLGTLRQFIGTNAASNSLYKGQQLYNQTGVDIGTQGRLSEAITTGERGTFDAGNQKIEGLIRKGMAYGIKDGKLDQYARITADAVQRNAEMGGQQDANSIANELASRARGIVGMEGDITESTLSQAAGIQDLLRQKSSQTTGLAGASNFLGILNASEESGIQLSPAQMMLAAQTSNKGGNALKKLLIDQGFSEDQASSFVDKVMVNKNNVNFDTGDKATNQFLANQLYGTTTEKTLDIQRSSLGGTASGEDISLEGRGTGQAGAEGTLIQKNAQVDFKNFQAGLDNIEISTKLVNSSLQTFNENLQQSFKLMHEFLLNNGNLSK